MEGGVLFNFFYANGTMHRYRKGELILHAEDEVNGIYYIEGGFVKVYSVNSRGEQYILVVYGPGEFFPLVWLHRRPHRSIFYESLTASSVLRVHQADLEQAIRTDVALSFEMVERSLDQHGVLVDRISNLQYKFARERLVYYLLYLARRFGIVVNNEYEIGLRISHQVLASNINLSRESVGREIDRLLRKGTIFIRNGRIVLRDIPALAAELPGNSVSADWWGLASAP